MTAYGTTYDPSTGYTPGKDEPELYKCYVATCDNQVEDTTKMTCSEHPLQAGDRVAVLETNGEPLHGLLWFSLPGVDGRPPSHLSPQVQMNAADWRALGSPRRITVTITDASVPAPRPDGIYRDPQYGFLLERKNGKWGHVRNAPDDWYTLVSAGWDQRLIHLTPEPPLG